MSESALVRYVRVALPNVPGSQRQSVAIAAQQSAIGQGYSAQSVIDAIALFDGLYLHGSASSWQTSAATAGVVQGGRVGRVDDWKNNVALSQATDARRPLYQSGKLQFDGVDDRLVSSPVTVPLGGNLVCIGGFAALTVPSQFKVFLDFSNGWQCGFYQNQMLYVDTTDDTNFYFGTPSSGAQVLTWIINGTTASARRNGASFGPQHTVPAIPSFNALLGYCGNHGFSSAFLLGATVAFGFWGISTSIDESVIVKAERFGNAWSNLGAL